MGRHASPAGDRLSGKEPCRQHHLRVRRVRAAGDGGDDHRAAAISERPVDERDLRLAPGCGRASLSRRRSEAGSFRQRDTVLRPRRAGHAGLDVDRSSSAPRSTPFLLAGRNSPCSLHTSPPGRPAPASVPCPSGTQRLFVHGENPPVAPYSGDMLPIVALSATAAPPRAEELHDLLDHPVLLGASA